MRDTMLGYNDHGQQYHHQPIPSELSHNPQLVNKTYDTTTNKTLNHSGTTSESGHELSPKSNISKPIRRRSRVSKITPVTLLYANVADFRFLVQELTGYRHQVQPHKGPIDLKFSMASQSTFDPMVSNGLKGNKCEPPDHVFEMQSQGHEKYEGHNYFKNNVMPNDGYFSSFISPSPNFLDDFDDQFLLENGNCSDQLEEGVNL